MFLFERGGEKRSDVRAHYYPPKIPPVVLGNRENTIDGSAIFRAIGQATALGVGRGGKRDRNREREDATRYALVLVLLPFSFRLCHRR